MTLADPEDYDPKYKEWKMEDLPMLPETFKLEVIRQTGKAVPCRQRNSFTGRIFRRDHHRHRRRPRGRAGGAADLEEGGKFQKPIKRLWISSVTDKAIREGFENLKDGRDYDNLYDAAMCRAEADWLVGINATRALTCKYNASLSCGRVQTPTLSMIAKREEQIRQFVPKPYYGLQAKYQGLTFTWQDKESKSTSSFDKSRIESIREAVKKRESRRDKGAEDAEKDHAAASLRPDRASEGRKQAV